MMNQLLADNLELALFLALLAGGLIGILGSYLLTVRPHILRADAAARAAEQAQVQLHHHEVSLQREIAHHESVRADLNQQIRDHKQHIEQQQEKYLALSNQSARQQAELDQTRLNLEQQMTMLESAKTELKREFELTANRLFQAKSEQFTSANQTLLESTLSPFKSQLQDFR